MDIYDPKKRSQIMAKVRGKDSKPELAVRRFLHRRGLRYHLHRSDFPGKPDLVFTSRHVAVFVHGCFWHQHPGCRKAKLPDSRKEFWAKKLAANVSRDLGAQKALRDIGWKPIIIWECEIIPERLEQLYEEILTSTPA
ncbi:DNA mismatch endonuclease Vsr [Rhizobiales bacterium]|uniref:very short patch repair endonuclease n=1 Tax=Hongsoonwoonella zoysiae TaxID=2821844 RepID=UPI0015605FC0|nr:very short patch repair endonuclease [Hongsoonwoonella zoysiae]NRG17581.1 DNA mismatch endonuclease Vsr [Hongsoonwoonella zoysiae]